MSERSSVSRRDFLRTSAVAAGGLTIAFALPGGKRLASAQPAPTSSVFSPNAFLRIASDDTVTVLLARAEMGQGIWTTLPMLIAEELDTDWSTIRVEHALAAPPYAHTIYGLQLTGGSSSTMSEFARQRQAGAMARALLVEAAARRFGVRRSQCRTENGEVIAGAERARYGELAEAAGKLRAPRKVALKDPKDWKIIGTPVKRLDTPDKISGKARFGLDVQFPGLLTAVVARSPFFGGKVKSFDAAKASAVPGVRTIVQVPSGVAVVADHFWAAKVGLDALQVAWEPGPNAGLDSAAQYDDYRRLAATPGRTVASAGNVADALGKAAKVVDAEYAGPYLAHAAMEPLNCTVRIDADGCEIWAGTQSQTMHQLAAAKILDLEPAKVTLHTPFLGGSFGRRHLTSDYVMEAVHVAKAAGQPVKTVWTREDDVRGGYYRPSFVHRARIGLGDDGRLVAWQHTIVTESALAGTMFGPAEKDGIDGSSIAGVANSPYITPLPHHRVDLHTPHSGVTVNAWRSVGNSQTGFVMEGLVDELAHASGRDPVELRRALLKDSPEYLRVLELAAEKAGWGESLSPGRGRGIAVHGSFGSVVAQVAEVSVDGKGNVRVHRVVVAIDCGPIVNPDTVRAQLEGGIIYGLSAALFGEITLERGQVKQRNFHDYPVLRMNEAPAIETHLVTSTDSMGGAGEPAVPPIAAAVANAIFAATGKRIRRLPIRAADLQS